MLTFTTLWAFSADDKLMIFFLFFSKKQDLTFYAKCHILFSGKNKKKYFKMSSAENFTQVRHGEGFWSSTSEGHLVGAEKTWCGGVDCTTGAGDVCKCAEPCLCWWVVQWRVWSKGWCSLRLSTQPAALHHCAWSLTMRVPLWGTWEDLYAYDLVIIAEAFEECVRRLLTWKEAMEKRGLRVNAGKTKIMICGMGLDLLQSSGEFPCVVCRNGIGSNSIFCNSCQHWVHVGSSAWQRTLTTDVHGARELHAPWMADHKRKIRRTWQAGGGSFLLLPRRHAFNSRWLWTFNHNTYENCPEEVQGAATSSLFTPPLFQDTWLCVQLLCAEPNAPCQWDLAIDKTKPPTSAAEW